MQGSQYDQLTVQDTQRIVLYRSLNQNRTKSTKLNPESSWIGTNLTSKTRSFSTINPAIIQGKSKEVRQASLRYDCSSPKPISRSVEIARIRSIPAVYRHNERVLQVSETIA